MRASRGAGGRSARVVAAAALLVMASVGKCDLPQPEIGPLGAADGADARPAAAAGAAPHLAVAAAPATPNATTRSR